MTDGPDAVSPEVVEVVGAGAWAQMGRRDCRNGSHLRGLVTKMGHPDVAVPRTRRSGLAAGVIGRYGMRCVNGRCEQTNQLNITVGEDGDTTLYERVQITTSLVVRSQVVDTSPVLASENGCRAVDVSPSSGGQYVGTHASFCGRGGDFTLSAANRPVTLHNNCPYSGSAYGLRDRQTGLYGPGQQLSVATIGG